MLNVLRGGELHTVSYRFMFLHLWSRGGPDFTAPGKNKIIIK